ncbi:MULTISPECIES: IclR family transcriptional regulator [Sphingobium]|uniref:IclR family transcriptional regulator n=1 Tax=Sphingobium TaxID=165695 RepID=UPI000262B75C|nr:MULTISPECIES: IclR family transcriptional regulator [Sphingobium]ART37451.1 E207 [uncultured bacterium]WDA35480.1 IclR family transcriptional regulator [Sphingobium sp. YC-XJ3]
MKKEPPVDRSRAVALDRGLQLLLAVLADQGGNSLAVIAERVGLPYSTARRMLAPMLGRGMLVRTSAGHFMAGPALLAVPPAGRILGNIARPAMRRLAVTVRATIHLGLFEDDMITYIAKVHGGGTQVWTREGMQQEAYCSAIGRALLASLSERERRTYLTGGPFVALTDRTVTDPERIALMLEDVRRNGFAIEQGEVSEGLSCVAVSVPIANDATRPLPRLALSLARMRTRALPAAMVETDYQRLTRCAAAIANEVDRGMDQWASPTLALSTAVQ